MLYLEEYRTRQGDGTRRFHFASLRVCHQDLKRDYLNAFALSIVIRLEAVSDRHALPHPLPSNVGASSNRFAGNADLIAIPHQHAVDRAASSSTRCVPVKADGRPGSCVRRKFAAGLEDLPTTIAVAAARRRFRACGDGAISLKPGRRMRGVLH